MKKKSYIIQILYFSNFKITVTHELFLTKKKIQNKSVSWGKKENISVV